ncbi:hypothetical protein Y032_0030g2131 [Ancylostoma ceylanicum]|uniref:Uncharacterized protein n=1 Tax=Ancylostoma ceylanicum TaxID=53326 RepID=A0A016UQ94_9BILA|nr:hypothetical protein Y032_0030g2131 [Ancylostoma ceylanicum]
MTFVVPWQFRWSLDQDWYTDSIGLTFRLLRLLQSLEKSEPYETYSSKRLVKLQNGRSVGNQSKETTEEVCIPILVKAPTKLPQYYMRTGIMVC